MAKKSWTEKFNTKKEAEVKRIDKAFADMPEGCLMLIATPQIIADYVAEIPKGKTSSIPQMRKDLAGDYNADYTCPVTSGIFLRIATEKAYEELEAGKNINDITPFWRIISPKDKIAQKLSFGKDFIIAQRKKEGID